MGALIAAGLGAVGSFNSAYDESLAGRREQLQAEDNQRMANRAAGEAVARGAKQAGQLRSEGSQLIAKQKVAYAASGVDPSVGTAADVMADTRLFSEMDAQTAANNAAAEAWGFKRYGLNYRDQAALDAARSSSRVSANILGGVGRFAEGVGAGYSAWNSSKG